MSEEKNAFCGTLSEASVIQKDADRSNIVYLSFQEGIKGKIKYRWSISGICCSKR